MSYRKLDTSERTAEEHNAMVERQEKKAKECFALIIADNKVTTSEEIENVISLMVTHYLRSLDEFVADDDMETISKSLAFNLIGMLIPYVDPVRMHKMIDRAHAMWEEHNNEEE